MIFKPLNNHNKNIAQKLYKIWQESYIIEKEIIGAKIFPPLDRTISDFIKSKNNFYSYIEKNNLLGVIEIDCKADSIHIQSLVVSPNHFRKGIASKLIDKVFTLHKSLLYTVETGNDNDPAKKLYESKGARKVKVCMTEFGVKKIKFEKNERKISKLY